MQNAKKSFLKLFSAMIMLFLMVSFIPTNNFFNEVAYAGETITISNEDEFIDFLTEFYEGNTFEGSTITLSNNIDLEGVELPSFDDENISFKGVLNGANYSIYNLVIENNEMRYVTLFPVCDGVIKNLSISYESYFKGNYQVSGLVGR